MTAAPPIKVFQVATGNVGSEMIKRFATTSGSDEARFLPAFALSAQ
jgi:hypothetical protein